jgi:putative hydrolases of HD superfamily
MRSLVHLLHEIGMLAHIPRSGFAFLGTGEQSVAEHSFCAALIGHFLAGLSPDPVDRYKLMMLCLLHDLPESRMGDLNYVQKKYVQANVHLVLKDIGQSSPYGSEIVKWIEEYEEGVSLEAKLAHDADQLELLLVLRREQDKGNPKAVKWAENACKRLQTDIAKQVAEAILSTPSDEWWLKDPEDPHWIDGGKSKMKKKT